VPWGAIDKLPSDYDVCFLSPDLFDQVEKLSGI
jgi:hypothetical protein